MFVTEFESLLSQTFQEEEHMFFVGDFNINYQDLKNNSVTSRFNLLLQSFNLIQLVQDSTHIKNGILDLVIIDIVGMFKLSQIGLKFEIK